MSNSNPDNVNSFNRIKHFILHEINWNSYKEGFHKPLGLWALAVYGFFILFSTPFRKVINYIFISPLVSYCPKDSYLADIVFLFLLAYSIIYFYQLLKRRLFISINSVLASLTVMVVYIQFFRYNNTYVFYKFNFNGLQSLSYCDVFVLSVLVLVATYKSYEKAKLKKQTSLSLIEDIPLIKSYNDAYSRTGYAEIIASHISATWTEKSFSIGIVGEWGAGKTDFMNRLKEALDKDSATNITFEFNPWRANKPDAIIDDFFNSFSDKLKPYNKSIASKVRDYSKKILQTGKEIQYRFFDTLINECLPEAALQKRYETINDEIGSTGKKVIIFIDDLDRLSGREIIEVLRLIRNTANFANTFFITTIDQKYIINALKNTNDFHNEDEYLKKIFQLIVTLPAFKKQILATLIREFLITEDLEQTDKTQLERVISKLSTDYSDLSLDFYPAARHEDILESLIDNIRELKRFCNSFKIVFNILKDETDTYDLFVLELIKCKSIEVYDFIKNRRFLSYDNNHADQFTFNEKEWDELIKSRNLIIDSSLGNAIKNAIILLLKTKENKNARRFKRAYNFYLYFSYQLFNLISLKEFNKTLEGSSNDIKDKFNDWTKQGKDSELIEICYEVIDFQNSDILYKIVEAYLNIESNHNRWMIIVKKLIYAFRFDNQKRYFQNNYSLHREFLSRIMNNNSIHSYDRAIIANYFLAGIIQELDNMSALLSAMEKASIIHAFSKQFLFSKREWQKIIYRLFDKYLETSDGVSNETLLFLYLNIDSLAGKEMTLYKPACRRFKRLLMTNDVFFKGYLKHIFRSRTDKYDGYIVVEPYILEIWGSWSDFIERLKKLVTNEEVFVILKGIILNYTGNLLPFKISNQQQAEFVRQLIIENSNI